MRLSIPTFLVALALAGCAAKDSTVATPPPSAGSSPVPTGKSDPLSVSASGGTLKLGDDLAKAKSLFPAPAGAQVFDTSLSYAIVGTDGWAWADEKKKTSFEVALRKGKIVAILMNDMGALDPDAEKKQVAEYGEPTRKAESEHAAALVWDKPTQCRFFINLRKELPFFGRGSILMIGEKDDLKLLNYRADDPDTIIKQFSAAANLPKK